MTASTSPSNAKTESRPTARLSIDKLSARARTRLLALAAEYDPLGRMLTKARRRKQVTEGDGPDGGVESSDPPADAVSNSSELRPMRDMRLPPPGQCLRRDYKGREILVRVLERGFEFEGKPYRSLSAIANVATGSHWNGHLFFGLTRQEK